MDQEPVLPKGANLFLLSIALFFDAAKAGLTLLFGIGLILDPLVITPAATLVFWLVFRHYKVPMFTGRRAKIAWANEIVSFIPGVDGLPDWTAYAAAIWFISNRTRAAQRRAQAAQARTPQLSEQAAY